jgi:hypothetical protein
VDYLLAYLLASVIACCVWSRLAIFTDSDDESQAEPAGHFAGDQGEFLHEHSNSNSLV